MERILHGVNVGGCCLGMVTGAVELASSGGAVTAAGGGLSALALRKTPKAQTEIAERMVAALEAHLAEVQTPEAVQRQVVQVLDRFTPARSDIAAGDVRAAKIADHMRARVAAEAIDAEHREEVVLDAYADLLVAVLTPLCAPQTQSEANDREILSRQTAESALAAERHAEIVALMKAQEADQPLRDAGVSEAVILDLARKASVRTDNLEQAWIDLTAIFEAALQVQETALATNHADFVDEVIALTRDLAAKGEYGSALDALGDAMARDAEEQAAQQAAFEAREARLLQRQRNLLLLSEPAEAAAYLIAQADRASGDTADLCSLRQLQGEYYERGRDKGIAAELLIAIELSKAALPRASTAEARAAVFNDLAAALSILGRRDRGTARLMEAVQTYQKALLEFSREDGPTSWAIMQCNLGNSLQELGKRETNAKRVKDAVQAYRNALTEQHRERTPHAWAATQNNLGAALAYLGNRELGVRYLNEAAKAYRNALLERSQNRVPLEWAETKNNLGTALRILGERESSALRIREAVKAFQDALKERSRENVPLDWATTLHNLGNALSSLAEHEDNIAHLKKAVQAFRNALLERNRENVPLNWAETQNDLGVALAILGERENNSARLAEALEAYNKALLERTRESLPLAWAKTQYNIARTNVTIFNKTRQAHYLYAALCQLKETQSVLDGSDDAQLANMARTLMDGIKKELRVE